MAPFGSARDIILDSTSLGTGLIVLLQMIVDTSYKVNDSLTIGPLIHVKIPKTADTNSCESSCFNGLRRSFVLADSLFTVTRTS